MMSKYHYTNTDDLVITNTTPKIVTKTTILKLFIDSENEELKKLYVDSVNKHNNNVNNNDYSDSGFDLFCNPDENFKFVKKAKKILESTPAVTSVDTGDIIKIDFNVKTSMIKQYLYDDGHIEEKPLGFYMYPRSSTGSKSPLRMANSVGIIDSGYRGNLMSVFDVVYDDDLDMKYSRYIQLCSGDLRPFEVKIVDKIDELGVTSRGEGGFGSTGK